MDFFMCCVFSSLFEKKNVGTRIRLCFIRVNFELYKKDADVRISVYEYNLLSTEKVCKNSALLLGTFGKFTRIIY